ncbi:YigZ family protein [Paraglaciecola sp. 2405UD69-4]|uniref:YigZ family protein n=1 Tax=Paraglaciecola sp. 2405UD69-4 TaxID=3391836 RepID=UPI0039C91309
MSIANYQVPAKTWQVELEVKRSKFLTFAANTESRESAEGFIKELREQHPQANHVCWAYIAGAPDTTVRSMSDDGEPSGTAGMPMLKVLEYSGLGDIAVAVVRYFGGTKLGTGGLQRAYSDAVSLVLTDLPTTTKVHRSVLKLTYDYGVDGHVSRLLERYGVQDVVAEYDHQVIVTLAIATADLSQCKSELMNITAGKILINETV